MRPFHVERAGPGKRLGKILEGRVSLTNEDSIPDNRWEKHFHMAEFLKRGDSRSDYWEEKTAEQISNRITDAIAERIMPRKTWAVHVHPFERYEDASTIRLLRRFDIREVR